MIRRLLAALLACVVVTGALIVWELSRGPLSLASFIPSLEDAVRGADGDWRIDIGDLVLMSDLKIHARSVNLVDKEGTAVLQVPDVVVRPSLRALLNGMVAISAVEISGAEASVRRYPGGSFGVAPAEAPPAPGTESASSELLEELLEPARLDRPIGFLQRFRIVDARVRIEDVESKESWIVEHADIALARGAASHLLALRAVLPAADNRGEPTHLEAQLTVQPSGAGFAFDGQARAVGIDVGRLGLYWPQNVAQAARRWVTERIPKGRVPEVVVNVALQSEQGVALKLTRLDGSFRYEELEVRWSDEAPKVTAIAGTATFDRTGMRFDVTGGLSDKIRVGSARVDLKGLDEDKERIKLTLSGNGPLSNLWALVPKSSGAASPEEVIGDGSVVVDASFPLRAALSFADVDLRVHVEPKSVRLKRAEVDAVLSGKVRYQKPPAQTGTVVADLAVQQARVDAGPIRLTPSAQEKGEVGFQLNFATADWRIDPLRVDYPGLQASGSAVVSTSGGPISVNLRNVVYGGTKLDALAGKWGRRGVVARLGRGSLDLAPFLGEGKEAGTKAAAPGGEAGGPDLSITAPGLSRVSFDADSWLENVNATIVRENGDWRTFLLSGELPRALWSSGPSGANNKKALVIRLEPTGPARRLEAHTEDLGAMLRAVNISDNVSGGTLVVSGRADDSGRDTRLRAHLKATNFVVRGAPLALRILSVAALDRFVGTLQSDGLQFDSLKGIAVVKGGRYELQNFRAHGTSLAWTANGWIDTDANRLSVEGALIPAQAANKILRSIPLLGELFTGRDGRGLIAISYKVQGDLQKPQITTNPLTALTPGFLREVWELGPKD